MAIHLGIGKYTNSTGTGNLTIQLASPDPSDPLADNASVQFLIPGGYSNAIQFTAAFMGGASNSIYLWYDDFGTSYSFYYSTTTPTPDNGTIIGNPKTITQTQVFGLTFKLQSAESGGNIIIGTIDGLDDPLV